VFIWSKLTPRRISTFTPSLYGAIIGGVIYHGPVGGVKIYTLLSKRIPDAGGAAITDYRDRPAGV
jgi:hypothetical protein